MAEGKVETTGWDVIIMLFCWSVKYRRKDGWV